MRLSACKECEPSEVAEIVKVVIKHDSVVCVCVYWIKVQTIQASYTSPWMLLLDNQKKCTNSLILIFTNFSIKIIGTLLSTNCYCGCAALIYMNIELH